MKGGVEIERKRSAEPRFALADSAIRVAPSLLSADFSRLDEAVHKLESAGASVLHLDVMDGHFAPNISFGVPVIASLRKRTNMFFDTHLMIQEPQRYAEAFVKAGADHLTFHIEVANDPKATIEHIRALGASVGVSINPATEIDAIMPILEEIDLVLIMSVWPGFGGQSFIDDVLRKVEALRKRLGDHQRLEIDGGVDPTTIGPAAAAGADTFVAGTAIFGAPNPTVAFAELHRRAVDAANAREI